MMLASEYPCGIQKRSMKAPSYVNIGMASSNEPPWSKN
jgi:hypothetical protein